MTGFQFLNLAPCASVDEITRAWQKLRFRYHPDKNTRDPPARLSFIGALLDEAREDCITGVSIPRFPMLEFFDPVLGESKRCPHCGWILDNREVCYGCGHFFLPSDNTKENKDYIWALAQRVAHQALGKRANPASIGEYATKLYDKHFRR